MLKASPGLGTGSITLKNDWRVTPLGKYLRGSKVNEIPQLINIFIGNMSVVGPRPLMKVDFDKFTPEIQDKFYNCKPGLTGIASIIFRDWYQQHISLYTDVIIIFLTAWAILSPKNKLAYKIFKDLPLKPAELSYEQ